MIKGLTIELTVIKNDSSKDLTKRLTTTNKEDSDSETWKYRKGAK